MVVWLTLVFILTSKTFTIMFTKNAFVVLGILIVFCSCGGRDRDERIVVGMLDSELNSSAKSISHFTQDLYHALESQLENPSSKYKAEFWQPKAIIIKNEAENVCKYIDSIKLQGNIDWKVLLEKLQYCKEKLGGIDTIMAKEFNNKMEIAPYLFDSVANSKIRIDEFYQAISKQSQISILSKIYARMRIVESELVRFCFMQTGVFDGCGFSSQPRMLVNQNTNHLKLGDELVIKAGIGIFSSKQKPIVMIGNKVIETEGGVANYKFKVNGGKGKYVIPVQIEYMNEDGREVMQTETLEYTIDQ
jgi:hypothetical protein